MQTWEKLLAVAIPYLINVVVSVCRLPEILPKRQTQRHVPCWCASGLASLNLRPLSSQQLC